MPPSNAVVLDWRKSAQLRPRERQTWIWRCLGRAERFHHNLLAHHHSRNPTLGEYVSTYPLTDRVDLRNNVIYNWQGNTCYGGEGMNVNMVNNYYDVRTGTATCQDGGNGR